MPPLQNHSTDITKKASTSYGGMITLTDNDREYTITAPLNKRGEYGIWWMPLHLFKIDNAPASTRIKMTPYNASHAPYEIEIAVSGSSTGWIKISDLWGKSADPESDNIVAPGVILTGRSSNSPKAIDYVIIYPNY